MAIIQIEKRADRVAIISLDTPGSPVNLLSRELLREIAPVLRTVLADSEIEACVLASAKPAGFVAGADLKELRQITSASEAEALSLAGAEALALIENSPKPFVAAIHGAALGGGLEIALACQARVATEHPKTVLGLPEVQLGLLPGAGGTQRLPRLIGLPAALGMLLTGANIRAGKALRLGLVDRLCARDRLVEEAAALALGMARGRFVPSRAGQRGMNRILLLAARVPLLGGRIYRKPRADVRRKTRGLYPAPIAILECVETGLGRGRSRGAAAEARLFGTLVASAEAKNLVRLFLDTTALKKAPDGSAPVRRLLVLGAGLMGEGIASVSLPLGPVTLRDPGAPALARAKANVDASLKKRIEGGGLAPEERERQNGRLRTVSEISELSPAEAGETDLVIEAVFEDLGLKRRVLAECEARIRPDAVFASNTSALPITEIAAQAAHPERVLGMHYFSPVPKMPLLEIVVTPRTSESALRTAHAFGAAQGKAVIIVKDSPGFYTTRILGLFLAEAVLLLEEGAGVVEIDDAIRDFGFPVGPITLLDEVGIDVGAHVAQDLSRAFAHRGMQGSDFLARLNTAGFAGRKNRKGFYLYDEAPGAKKKKGPKRPNPEVSAYLKKTPGAAKPGKLEIQDRIVLMMVNEAAHCLQEKVIRSARDGDVGAILGLGFPPFRGGPFRYIETLGSAEIIARLSKLAEKHGERFKPAAVLEGFSRSDPA